MRETAARFQDKAERAITAGDDSLAAGHVETAAGRAYYAMFYAAEALPDERGLRFRKHGGVHGAIGEHFVKAGTLDPKYHRWLLTAFNKRITADYGIDAELTVEEVGEMLTQAREFIRAARNALETPS